ncbi:MAG: hypothetical protein ICV66_08315 [Chitinophagaceae bacterium]|nr:hypothetical protein [Chitinophagaceae bacterium]
MTNQITIAQLLLEEPLYRRFEVDIKYYHPLSIENITFEFFCDKESSHRTFKLALAPEEALKKLSGNEYIETLNPFKSENDIDFVQYYVGHCQSCKNYTVNFLLHVFSEGKVDRRLLPFYRTAPNATPIEKENVVDKSKLFIRKVGQWPSFKIKPDAILYSFLEDDDKDYYNKALNCLSHNYGIGAFAYLRKIVEKEIVKIVQELAKEDSPDFEEINALLEEFGKNKHMGPLVDNVFKYLPKSLKIFDHNPLKTLWSNLSEGIHRLTDEECLSIAFAMDKLLQLIVKKLREEQTELREIRNLLKEINKK